MSIEALSENSSCNLEAFTSQEEPTTDWNGHTLNQTQIDPRIKKMQKHIRLLRQADCIPCGETVDGKASIAGSADTEGNTKIEVEVEVENKEHTISGSVSGSVSRDAYGETEGSIKIEGVVRF